MIRSTPPTRFYLSGCTRALGILLICLVTGLPGAALARSDNSAFPLYPVIEDNVRFWKDIYTKYSLNTAVIHDKNDLSVVYEVVTVVDEKLPGAAKVNKMLLDSKKNHYAAILQKLSQAAPGTAEERRIAALFPGRGSARRMARAAESVRVQTGQKERFLKGVIRSGAYLPAIKKIFRLHNLPEDLAYLPHVESSFDTKAYSKLGASGVWQFTYSTGKQYLRINTAVDERGDPILAAHAAAKYLKNSYNLLGSWPLALTSYNYGTGGMKRAVKDKGSYERIFSEYSQGYFKFASRNFYSEFLAALAAAKEFESNPAIRLDRPEPTRVVTLKGNSSIKEIKNHFGVSAATLEHLNPALRPSVFSGQNQIPRGYSLHLPSNKKRAEPEPIIVKARAVVPEAETHRVHKVKKGDTLNSLARKYHITPEALIATNDLQSKEIQIDQTLRIPSPSAAARSATSKPLTADLAPKQTNGRYGVFQSVVHNGKRFGKIQVQPGETLKMLAGWANLTTTALRRINNMSEETVHPDRSLVLRFDKVSPGEFQKKRASFHQSTERHYFSTYSVVGIKNYTVAAEDTIWDICHTKFTIPIWLLQKYNASKDLTQLRSSMELVIPIVKAI